MTTKAQLIADAYAELALGGIAVDLEPEEQQAAHRRLNAMMAMWHERGISVGYNLPGGIDDESGVPDFATEAVVCSLAIRCAGQHGKQVPAQTAAMAKMGYDTLILRAAQPMQQQLKVMPMGAGSQGAFTYGRFTAVPTDRALSNTPGGDLSITESAP